MFVAVVTPAPQLNVAPVVVEEAVKVMLVVEQDKVAGVAMLEFGSAMFCVIVIVAVVEQPFVGSVTVTV